jgi:hypothetical protein
MERLGEEGRPDTRVRMQVSKWRMLELGYQMPDVGERKEGRGDLEKGEFISLDGDFFTNIKITIYSNLPLSLMISAFESESWIFNHKFSTWPRYTEYINLL